MPEEPRDRVNHRCTTPAEPEAMSDIDAITALAALNPLWPVPPEATLPLVVRLIAVGLEAYRTVVEGSFGSMKNCFPLYAAMPVICLVAMGEQSISEVQRLPYVSTRYEQHPDL